MSAPARSWWVFNVVMIVGVLVMTTLGVITYVGERNRPPPRVPAFVDLERSRELIPVPVEPATLAHRFGGAVWQVEAAGCGDESIGTAFAVSDRLLVTAGQVAGIDPAPQVVSQDGRRRLDAVVVGTSDDPDLAILEVQQYLVPTLAWADPSELVEGGQLVVLGTGGAGQDHVVTPVEIRSLVPAGAAVPRAIHAEGLGVGVGPGSPALTVEGRVAGVLTELLAVEDQPPVPVLLTHEHLREQLELLVAQRPGARVRCEDLGARAQMPGDWAEPG